MLCHRSWGGARPRVVGYVTVTGTKDGATAAGCRSCLPILESGNCADTEDGESKFPNHHDITGSMKLEHAVNIEDLHRAAKRRIPRAAFDYFEGGVEDEIGLARNEQSFRRYRLVPRYLVDVSKVDQAASLFDRTYASPFGVGPTAGGGYLRKGADLMVAEAAAAANIPYVMSGLSSTRLEAAAKVAPQHAWFQLYGAKNRKISEDMIRRANDAGFNGLVFTRRYGIPPG